MGSGRPQMVGWLDQLRKELGVRDVRRATRDAPTTDFASDVHNGMIRRASLLLASAALACSSGEAREAREGAPPQVATAGVVDSILPLEEALLRFRADLVETTVLEGGAASRDELVRRFVSAVETHDTTALREMVLSRAEYAWLYYPASTFSREPHYQMPQLNWFLNVASSEKGITRVVTRYGGSSLEYAGYECPDIARTDGGLSFWDGCVLTSKQEDVLRRMRLFGSIIERGGQYKFYSYANDL